MKKQNLTPIFAVGIAATVFTLGAVNVANAEVNKVDAPALDWTHEQLIQEDAIKYWENELPSRLSESGLSPKDHQGTPGILIETADPDLGPDHKVYYEAGLLENLLERYVRCAGLEEAQASGPKALRAAAAESRDDFVTAKGVVGILDSNAYFSEVNRISAAEEVSPAEAELTYMCDVLELEDGK